MHAHANPLIAEQGGAHCQWNKWAHATCCLYVWHAFKHGSHLGVTSTSAWYCPGTTSAPNSMMSSVTGTACHMHSKRWSDAALIIKVFEEQKCWATCLQTWHNNLRRAHMQSYHSSSLHPLICRKQQHHGLAGKQAKKPSKAPTAQRSHAQTPPQPHDHVGICCWALSRLSCSALIRARPKVSCAQHPWHEWL
jgi:hypothetical protein